jgi:hypothetical protein
MLGKDKEVEEYLKKGDRMLIARLGGEVEESDRQRFSHKNLLTLPFDPGSNPLFPRPSSLSPLLLAILPHRFIDHSQIGLAIPSRTRDRPNIPMVLELSGSRASLGSRVINGRVGCRRVDSPFLSVGRLSCCSASFGSGVKEGGEDEDAAVEHDDADVVYLMGEKDRAFDEWTKGRCDLGNKIEDLLTLAMMSNSSLNISDKVQPIPPEMSIYIKKERSRVSPRCEGASFLGIEYKWTYGHLEKKEGTQYQ